MNLQTRHDLWHALQKAKKEPVERKSWDVGYASRSRHQLPAAVVQIMSWI